MYSGGLMLWLPRFLLGLVRSVREIVRILLTVDPIDW